MVVAGRRLNRGECGSGAYPVNPFDSTGIRRYNLCILLEILNFRGAQLPNLLLQLIPPLIIFVLLAPTLGVFAIARKMQRRGRRTPLTRDLLRNPGESLQEQVEDLGADLGAHFFAIMLVPPVLGLQLLLLLHFSPQKVTPGLPVSYAVILAGFLVYFTVQLVRTWRKRHKLRLGLECEMATGQVLNQLMLLGCRVYHDFPAEGFNIDHIVIGPAGVYAVETKGRAKPDKGRGAEDALVVYDAKSLRFPGWVETKPIAQAKRQAQWLANWLKSAVGEPVPVLPALVLPGWFIQRKAGDLAIFNAKSPEFLARPKGEARLSEAMIQRVAHQVEQRCRNVEPVAYGKKKGK